MHENWLPVWRSAKPGRRMDDVNLCYCEDPLCELERLYSAVYKVRTDAVADADDDPSVISQHVLDIVRAELQPGRKLPLGEPTEDLWITEAAAARTLCAAAESIPGVRAVSCSVSLTPNSAGGSVDVSIDVHAAAIAQFPQLKENIRQLVWNAAEEVLGLDTAAVEVRVTRLIDSAAFHGRKWMMSDNAHVAIVDEISQVIERVRGVAFLKPDLTGLLRHIVPSCCGQEIRPHSGLRITSPNGKEPWRMEIHIVAVDDAKTVDVARATRQAIKDHAPFLFPEELARAHITVTVTGLV